MVLGLAKRPSSGEPVLSRSLLPHRLRVPSGWVKVCRRDLITPSVTRDHRHGLRHAY